MASAADPVIRPFKPGDEIAFRDLNLKWIEHYFVAEPKDRTMLADVDAHILSKGGEIIVAELDGKVVGCLALLPMQGDSVELAKMAVDEGVRGRGIGLALLDQAVITSAAMGANAIWLESNTVLQTAIRLYQRAGFEKLSEDEMQATPYSRCNIQMTRHI
ncbi:MAG: GNAT family N-acetyltransferase [Hyphomonadaceae bacterium]